MRRTRKPLMLAAGVLTPALAGIPHHAEAGFDTKKLAALEPQARTAAEHISDEKMALMEALLSVPLREKQYDGAHRIKLVIGPRLNKLKTPAAGRHYIYVAGTGHSCGGCPKHTLWCPPSVTSCPKPTRTCPNVKRHG
jgi:hypothetical protein